MLFIENKSSRTTHSPPLVVPHSMVPTPIKRVGVGAAAISIRPLVQLGGDALPKPYLVFARCDRRRVWIVALTCRTARAFRCRVCAPGTSLPPPPLPHVGVGDRHACKLRAVWLVGSYHRLCRGHAHLDEGLKSASLHAADVVVGIVLRCTGGGDGGSAQSAKPVRATWRAWRWERVCGLGLLRVRGESDPRGWRGVRERCGRGAHRHEREPAVRGDRDAAGIVELGAGADAVANARSAGAGERGGRLGGDVDAANAVVALVLRCRVWGEAATYSMRRLCEAGAGGRGGSGL